jgi:hypothetical protein
VEAAVDLGSRDLWCERILGNNLVAATYELRALRLIGHDAFGKLPRVLRALESEGIAQEAEAARALFMTATM